MINILPVYMHCIFYIYILSSLIPIHSTLYYNILQIMTFIEKTLGHPYPQIILATIHLVETVYTIASIDMLDKSVYYLIICLMDTLSLVVQSPSSTTSSSGGSDGSGTTGGEEEVVVVGVTGVYVSQSGGGVVSVGYLPTHEEPTTTAVSAANTTTNSNANNKGHNLNSKIINKAIQVLISITSEAKTLPAFYPSIGLIPDHPLLAQLKREQNEYMNNTSFIDLVRIFSVILYSDSPRVRLNVMKLLSYICANNRSAICDLLATTTSMGMGDNNMGNINPVVELVKALLSLASEEVDTEVLLECGKVLGEIGAVDPSRLIDTGSPSNDMTTLLRSGNNRKVYYKTIVPWDTSFFAFGLHLIETYLVPGYLLSSTSLVQDRLAYGIQSILKLVIDSLSGRGTVGSTAFSQDVGTGVALGQVHSTGAPTTTAPTTEVPKKLKQALIDRKIAHITEPFFTSKYIISHLNIKKPPYYLLGYEHKVWIGMWTRYLGSICKGRWEPVFNACKGAVRSSADLSQYLLPYMVADIVCHHLDGPTPTPAPAATTSQRGSRSKAVSYVPTPSTYHQQEIDLLVIEICLVLSDGDDAVFKQYDISLPTHDPDVIPFLNEHRTEASLMGTNDDPKSGDMAVQTVFELLYVLERWVAAVDKILGDLASKKENRHRMPKGCTEEGLESFRSAIQGFIDRIPKPLLSLAALRIEAYASALRYYECHVREQKEINKGVNAVMTTTTSRSASSLPQSMFRVLCSKRNDGSNNALPTLSGPEIDQFIAIFSELNDSESLQGCIILRQILGYPSSAACRVMEYEQREEWLSAYDEYGVMRNSLITSIKRSQHAYTNAYHHSHSLSPIPPTGARPVSPQDAADRLGAELDELGSLDQGRLRCLVELGHLESVISQVR